MHGVAEIVLYWHDYLIFILQSLVAVVSLFYKLPNSHMVTVVVFSTVRAGELVPTDHRAPTWSCANSDDVVEEVPYTRATE